MQPVYAWWWHFRARYVSHFYQVWILWPLPCRWCYGDLKLIVIILQGILQGQTLQQGKEAGRIQLRVDSKIKDVGCNWLAFFDHIYLYKTSLTSASGGKERNVPNVGGRAHHQGVILRLALDLVDWKMMCLRNFRTFQSRCPGVKAKEGRFNTHPLMFQSTVLQGAWFACLNLSYTLWRLEMELPKPCRVDVAMLPPVEYRLGSWYLWNSWERGWETPPSSWRKWCHVDGL